MKTGTHSDRALALAFSAMEPCHARTAVLVLAMGLAAEAQRMFGREKAAELAYMIADQLAVDLKT